MAAKVENKQTDLIRAFRQELNFDEKLLAEFDKYAAFSDKLENQASPKIHTSLELNLMLAFLYLAGLLCKLPMLEHDILCGAQTNKYGYLTEYKKTAKLFPELKT